MPTSKASLLSASTGLATLLGMVIPMTDEQVDEIMDNDEAIRLDKSIHSLLDYAEAQQ
ncbi:MAG: hypothetical protein ACYS7Y_26925 [Planctomycetota bacterium]